MAGNKSQQAKAQSTARKAAQQDRGSNKFKNNSKQAQRRQPANGQPGH
ncbi:MAG: hypothetical protein IPL43_13755 [Micropruina sp.]|nr:hypothetical protein [Micropruina sp.]